MAAGSMYMDKDEQPEAKAEAPAASEVAEAKKVSAEDLKGYLELIERLREKYEIENDFGIDPETGEIIESEAVPDVRTTRAEVALMAEKGASSGATRCGSRCSVEGSSFAKRPRPRWPSRSIARHKAWRATSRPARMATPLMR